MSNFRLGDTSILFDVFADHSSLTTMEIEQMVELFDKNVSEESIIGDGVRGRNDPSYRKSNIIWFTDEFLEKNNYYDVRNKITNRVNDINDIAFKYDLLYIENFQLTQYTSSDGGFYNYHTDASPVSQNLTRKLSFVIQLNDPSEYKGGDFCIMTTEGTEFNVTQQRPELMQKGNIIAFPSFLPHKVTPVTSGKRHTLVGWCNGPRFR